MFKNNLELLNTKKVRELFIGCELAYIIQEQDKKELKIGFPIREDKCNKLKIKPHILLKELLLNPKYIQDYDTDICITISGEENKYLYRLQLSRLISGKTTNFKTEDIILLLKKKFMVQTDKSIYLLIHIEENTEMELDKLINFIKKEKVPYGAIYVSGLISNKEPIARFYRIYPDFSTYQRNMKYFI